MYDFYWIVYAQKKVRFCWFSRYTFSSLFFSSPIWSNLLKWHVSISQLWQPSLRHANPRNCWRERKMEHYLKKKIPDISESSQIFMQNECSFIHWHWTTQCSVSHNTVIHVRTYCHRQKCHTMYFYTNASIFHYKLFFLIPLCREFSW